ncbi:RES family NAD+ phosphorylase [Muricauda oceani]|uniref:RES family NAD+ phosphorylase n=1 Tax=Flagellimonas oceani TaxID=2698672 RepID=A0A6G7J6U8_9FLAO|nr:RES family NAD+ phosphorylase [Allomuricauda oceani]MBW8242504.1 RES family NAD+ phosphorylase [Allomuricauda oceani]QII46264.1 RES family NAD+ phosphorylase [Allomuricauda oceani]
MKVCPNCFADTELKSLISASTMIGDCTVCNTKEQPIMDIDEFKDFFQELIDNYIPTSEGENIKNKIQGNWSFFSDPQVAERILNFVIPEIDTEISNANSPVEYIEEILNNHGYWETLKNDLKWSNRFLLNIEQLLDLGWDGFFNTQYRLTPETCLFRARVHHQSGNDAYTEKDMYSPKRHFAKGGRANPSGIPYLYLCDNPETVLYEVRASYLDELSIASFQLKSHHEFVNIVDFTEDTPLFRPEMVRETIMAKLLRERISQDLSKPMRRYDSEIEYIPTQFICEFIRVYTGASGIRFASSLHPSGKNIVVFDQSLMDCTVVDLHKVTKFKLKSKEVI